MKLIRSSGHALTSLYSPVTDAGLMALQEMASLRQLEIVGTKTTDGGLAHLKKLTDLQILNLANNPKLTAAGLVHLKGMSGLQQTKFGNTEVSDEGLVHLKGLLGLRVLDLQQTRVTDAGLENLAGLRSLAKLNLTGTAVTVEGVAKLKAALPNCNIEWDRASQPKADLDPDRKAAEYVLSIGGVVRVNDEMDDTKAAADLPQQPFRLTYVNLAGNPKVRNAGLAAFDGCKHLTVLRINETPVTDEGLAYFKGCKNLEILALQGTEIGDAGLANFKDFKNLTHLSFDDTQVTDKGLAYFKGCDKLETLAQRGSKVTKAGLDDFRKALPKCSIDSPPDVGPTPPAPADPFQTSSVWVNNGMKMTLTVTERNGETFRAHFEDTIDIEREVTGTVKDGKLSWLAKDVRATKGGPGHDNQATITRDADGYLLDFTYGPNGRTIGAFVLRLKTSK